jgi:hypothetical protein
MFLLFVLMWGPAPALAVSDYDHPDLVLYEVTEDMYLVARDGKSETYVTDVTRATNRQAVAQLSGTAKLGTPLCPKWVKQIAPKAKSCTVNAKGADDLSLTGLTAGKGTLKGVYAVVVQGDNKVDAPEFVIMTGSFTGDADLSLSMAGQAPIGFITNGVGTIDGYDGATFTFSGTFRLPFAFDEYGRSRWGGRYYGDAYYLGDDRQPVRVKNSERSLGWPTVRLDIEF